MKSIALLLSVLVASGGCYLGRSKSSKYASYTLNGMALVAGTAILISSRSASSGCDGCLGFAVSDQFVQSTLGTLIAVPAAIGIVMNLATPTEPDPAPRSPGAANAATAVRVTAPGLRPATVQLR